MNTPSRPLQVLIAEDSENDAALLEIELERAGYAPVCQRVETAPAMSAALQSQTWDLVIADYVMPHFNGLAALALVREQGLDLPFIIVSGHITDADAVAAMKAGAHDYVMKDNLSRLGSAVERELREAEGRRDRRRSEERLSLEHALREAIENSVPAGIAAVDLEGRQTYVNPAFCAMVGWSESELVGALPPFAYWAPDQINAIVRSQAEMIKGDAPASGLELPFCRRTGERIDVLVQVTPLTGRLGNLTGWVSSVLDITERKRAETRLAAEHAITRILANAQSLTEAAPAILQVLLDSLEVDFGALWGLASGGQQLDLLVNNLRAPSPPLTVFLQESRRLSFRVGMSIPGRAWQQGRAVWVADLALESHFERKPLATQAGLHSAMAFPVQNARNCFGVLEFFSRRRMESDPTVLNMMAAIGSEISQFIQRRSAEAALRLAHTELETRVEERTAQLKSANAKLQTAILERKRLEHELLDITEKERRRIGLDLHDDLGQKLSGIALMTKGLELKLAKRQVSEAEEAAKIHSLVQQAMSHASDLAHDLATLDFKEKSLPAALKHLAAQAREMFRVTCRCTVATELPSLEPNAVHQLYKIAQEAVTNAIKHGKAKQIRICLAKAPQQIRLTVHNDGLPFPDLRSSSTGMGLRIMNYRASLLGASLDIQRAGAHGTRVACALPLPERGPAPVPAAD